MNYIAGSVSDVGIKRKSNQDSLYYALAEYQGEKLAYMVICDGMGGFAKGELASAEVLTTFENWFRKRLPEILREGFSAEVLREEWYSLAEAENSRVSEYASINRLKMGTTLTAALFLGDQYYIIHVGDCRLYEIRDSEVLQLTHDHTVTQREIDNGLLSPEDAETDSRQHILLQCLGAGREIAPDFVVGTIRPETAYLLCSDGFRHKFSRDEMLKQLNAQNNPTKKKIQKNLTNAIDCIKDRGETDNITAGLLVVV